MADGITLAGLLRGRDEHPSYRMAMLPFGTYPNPDGSESLGLALPGMISEPIDALKRLAQNSVLPDGRLGIPEPSNPQNQQDVLTGLLSLYGGNALNPLAAIPKNAVGMFAGRMAKTADQAALSRAEEMAANGADRAAIWNETGWFQGSDGKWRFEIDDSGARLGGKALADLMKGGAEGATQRTLAGVIHHNPLYDAYPDLRRIDVDARFNPRLKIPEAQYQDIHPWTGRPAIDISTNTLAGDFGPLSAGLHEVQHGIQSMEGTAKGGTPGIGDRAPFIYSGPIVDKLRAEQKAVEDQLSTIPYMSQEFSDLAKRRSELDKQMERGAAIEGYRRLAGEVEARNVQARMNMTPEERRATPPWLTQDVPDDQQIIRFLSDTGLPSLMGSALAGSREDSRPPTLSQILRSPRAGAY